MKIVKWIASLSLLAIVGLVVWLAVAPPDLIRVATNYSAKIVCSNVFIAGRDPEEVMAIDVQAPGHPILGFVGSDVDRNAGTVRTRFLGFFAEGLAVHREGFGCTSVPSGNMANLKPLPKLTVTDAPDLPVSTNAAVQSVIENDDLAGPGVRAVVVMKGGRIIAERYADGFDEETPLLGWSMAKTVTAALTGLLVKDGRTTLETASLFPEWQGDARAKVQLQDMLGMASSLTWNEGYGTVSDVTRMLYLEDDMSAFVRKADLEPADGSKIGDVFNYSSGTTVAIAGYLQSLFDDPLEAFAFARERLFNPLGMETATIESDAAGTLVGGSYIYASARNWARFGQMLLNGGRWNGEQVLPAGFVDWMTQVHPGNENGSYGRGQIWLKPPNWHKHQDTPFPLKGWWLAGHDGQSVGIFPDHDMVIVRMGLTPSPLNYWPAPLAEAVIGAATP